MPTNSYRQTIITITVILCAMMQLVDGSIVNVAIPYIMGNLGADVSQASWVLTSYIFANVIVIPMSGWLSEFFGRKKYYLISIAVFVGASVFCGQATGIWELVIFRFIQGIGGGGLIPTSKTILIENYPPEDLSKAMALFGMGVVIGPTIGPTLGGWLTTAYSWRWIFYVNVPIGIIAFMMVSVNVRNVGAKLARVKSVDWPGILLLFIGFGSLQIMLQEGQRHNWFDSNFIIWLCIVSITGIILFVWRELTAENPVVDLRVLRHRNLAVGSGFGAILGFGGLASVFIFPLYLENLLGYSALQTGLLLIPSALTAALMMPVVSFVLRRGVSARLVAIFGFIVFFIFSWIMSNQSLASGAGDFYLPLVLRGMGMGCLSVPINTITMWGLEGHDLAEGSALSSITRSLGASIGIAMVTVLLQQRLALHWNRLVSNVTPYDQATQSVMQGLTNKFISSGSAPSVAHHQAIQAVAGTVQKSASMMSYNDVFLVIGIFFLICIPFLILLKPPNTKKETDAERIKQSEEVEYEPS